MRREGERHEGLQASRHEVNRALLLTPAGSAAIATIRIYGPDVENFLSQHFSASPVPLHCIHGRLTDGETVIDDPVIVLSEDKTSADLHIHGGPWVVQSALALLEQNGFTLIDANSPLPIWAADGETTIEREIELALPLAKTDLALRVLLAQKEAWNDFQSKIKNQKEKIPAILADHALHHLLHPPRVAIVGVANVGKSTLANQLFAQERSITADLPGTTRDWVGELANLDGLAVLLVDTPGLRDTPDLIEQHAIDQSRPVIEGADLIVLVLDPTQPLDNDQRDLIARWPAAIRVINKSDREAIWNISEMRGIPTVATTGAGVDELRRAIRLHFGCDNLALRRPRVWTQRQRDELLALAATRTSG
jgi:small GTP-binding protein